MEELDTFGWSDDGLHLQEVKREFRRELELLKCDKFRVTRYRKGFLLSGGHSLPKWYFNDSVE